MDKEAVSTLLTDTPQQGFDLAARVSWEMVKVVQPSKEMRERVLAIYGDDAEYVLKACQIIAANFQMIAVANDYWRGHTLM
jgi:hypothetical protein